MEIKAQTWVSEDIVFDISDYFSYSYKLGKAINLYGILDFDACFYVICFYVIHEK